MICFNQLLSQEAATKQTSSIVKDTIEQMYFPTIPYSYEARN